MSAIIHFGMPKTGSTSIQSTLSAYCKETRGASFDYLGYMGSEVNATPLVRILYRSTTEPDLAELRNRYGIRLPQIPEEKARALDYLNSRLAATDGKLVVLSSEGIPPISEADLSDMLGRFRTANMQTRAIGYVRYPKGFMESNFQQQLKNGARHINLSSVFPKYKRNLEKFIPVFGEKNVEFVLFDPKAFPAGCVVQDFAQRIGLDLPIASIRRENDGLSRQAISLLYAYRKHASNQANKASSYGTPKFRLIDKMTELRGEKIRFHSSMVTPFYEKYRDEVSWMENILGASLTENISADDDVGIRSEADLLRFAPEALEWLAQNISDKVQAGKLLSGKSEEVAKGVHCLLLDLTRNMPVAKQPPQTCLADRNIAQRIFRALRKKAWR